jgi:glutaredoxin-like protein NrdH
MITVYTMPDCSQCEWTKKFLDRRGFEYETIDISTNPEALDKVTAMGYKSAPVVVTDNDSWSGFRLTKLSDLQK